MELSCLQTLKDEIESTAEHYAADGWHVNEEKLSALEDCFGEIDREIVEKNVCFAVSVTPIGEQRDIRLRIECPEIEIGTGDFDLDISSDAVCRLLGKALSVGFKHSGEDRFFLEFVFPGIWQNTVHEDSLTELITESEKKELLTKAKEMAKENGFREDRSYDLIYCDHVLRKCFHGSGDVEVETVVNRPLPYYGAIYITGCDLQFDDPAVLVSVLEKGAYMDVRPLYHGAGRIQIGFTYCLIYDEEQTGEEDI